MPPLSPLAFLEAKDHFLQPAQGELDIPETWGRSDRSALGAQRELLFGAFWFAFGLFFGLGCLRRLHLVFDDCVSLSNAVGRRQLIAVNDRV